MGVALVKILESPFTISATAESSEFKFGMQLVFAKAHHKITPRGKHERGPGLGELPNILGFSFNISATAKDSNFTFGMQLGFARAIIKSHPEEKVGVALG